MALNDGQMHGVSIVGAIVLTGALALFVVLMIPKEKSSEGSLADMEVIEASLAYAKTPAKQPQKEVESKPKTDDKQGIAKDEKTAKPKKDDKEKPLDLDISKFDHGKGDEDEKPTTKIGDFNASEHGNAAETKGDPWLGKLTADMEYSPPEISRGDSSPVGCVHLTPEGKIADTKFTERTSDDFQTAAETALKQLEKTRNANPEPVPTHLLKLTTKWLCFKFSVKAQ